MGDLEKEVRSFRFSRGIYIYSQSMRDSRFYGDAGAFRKMSLRWLTGVADLSKRVWVFNMLCGCLRWKVAAAQLAFKWDRKFIPKVFRLYLFLFFC